MPIPLATYWTECLGCGAWVQVTSDCRHPEKILTACDCGNKGPTLSEQRSWRDEAAFTKDSSDTPCWRVLEDLQLLLGQGTESWPTHICLAMLQQSAASWTALTARRLRNEEIEAWVAGRRFKDTTEAGLPDLWARAFLGGAYTGPFHWPMALGEENHDEAVLQYRAGLSTPPSWYAVDWAPLAGAVDGSEGAALALRVELNGARLDAFGMVNMQSARRVPATPDTLPVRGGSADMRSAVIGWQEPPSPGFGEDFSVRLAPMQFSIRGHYKTTLAAADSLERWWSGFVGAGIRGRPRLSEETRTGRLRHGIQKARASNLQLTNVAVAVQLEVDEATVRADLELLGVRSIDEFIERYGN